MIQNVLSCARFLTSVEEGWIRLLDQILRIIVAQGPC